MLIFRNILVITLPALLLLFICLEVLSRFFFPGSEVPKSFYDEKNQLLKYSREYGIRGLWTHDVWAVRYGRWRINNDGWNSPLDYFAEKKPGIKRIAVIGDSYIEALQVDAEMKYPSLLDNLLGDNYEVYSFGMSGSPLSQYLHMARYAAASYDPDIYIFNLVHNDFHESIQGLAYFPMFLTVKPAAAALFAEVLPVSNEQSYHKVPGSILFRQFSLFRYFYYNLKLMERFKAANFKTKAAEMNVAVEDILDKKELITGATRYLLTKIKTELGHKKIIFIMDAPRLNIYAGDLAKSNISWLNRMMGSICRELELPFIDLTKDMLLDYLEHKKRFETEYDNHWNAYGHRFVAGVLYDYLTH